MKNFPLKENAAFYHVSPLENLNSIETYGLIGRNGKIFVPIESRECILAAVADEQIPEIHLSKGFIVIELSQERNQSMVDDIYRDNQVNNERAKVYQFVILSERISPDRLSIVKVINFGDEGPSMLSRLANPISDIGKNHDIYLKAAKLNAKEFPKQNLDPYWNGS